MTQSVDVPQDLIDRLGKLARPFLDTTPVSVIRRAVEALEREVNGDGNHQPSTVPDANGRPLPEFEATNPPNLTFTKVVSASFNGAAVKPTNWNRLLDAALMHAAKQIGDFTKLRQIAAVNLVQGKKTDEGYHHLEGADISVQGQDANAAWRGAMFIAQNLKCSVEVSFLWRNREGAEHPGKAGSMRFG